MLFPARAHWYFQLEKGKPRPYFAPTFYLEDLFQNCQGKGQELRSSAVPLYVCKEEGVQVFVGAAAPEYLCIPFSL